MVTRNHLCQRNYSTTDKDKISSKKKKKRDEHKRPNLLAFQQQWFEYSNQMDYNQVNIKCGSGLRTSSSPDLLEESPSQIVGAKDLWRFYDDMTVELGLRNQKVGERQDRD